MGTEQPKLYTELAGWWQLVSPTEDYADEAAFFGTLLRAENARTLLELGSGGGNVAWFLKKDFTLTLTDISGGMLMESKKQNPEVEHIEGNMRVLRLGRTFDAVLIQIVGVFPRATWLRLLGDVGFEGKVVEDTSNDDERSEVFLGFKS